MTSEELPVSLEAQAPPVELRRYLRNVGNTVAIRVTTRRLALGLFLLGTVGLGACDGNMMSSGVDAATDSGQRDAPLEDSMTQDAGADARAGDAGFDVGSDVPPDVPGTPCDGPRESVSVWIIGDSTVSSGSGWGDYLAGFLADDATLENRARSGRSSKSFYEEDNSAWSESDDAVMRGIAEGDYVLIQFGHNDSAPQENRHTEPGDAPEYDDTFRLFLEHYISETRAAGANPILVTPVSTMRFSSDGSHRLGHGEYPAAARRVAEDNGIALLELELESSRVFNELGEEETLSQYAGYAEDDRTHFPEAGGMLVAEMVAGLLTDAETPLACYVR